MAALALARAIYRTQLEGVTGNPVQPMIGNLHSPR